MAIIARILEDIAMPLAQLECVAETLYADRPAVALAHLLIVMPKDDMLPPDLPGLGLLQGVLKRRQMKVGELAKTPLALESGQGQRCVYVMVDAQMSRFARQEVLRKAAALLLEETPTQLGVQVIAEPEVQPALAAEALYVAWVNGTPLPSCKKKPAPALKRIVLSSQNCRVDEFAAVAALAAGNHLCRQLTATPANQLTPQLYRRSIRKLAKARHWALEELDFKTLERMGAGGFCAVAQGSSAQDAAIVHLRYQPKAATRGKGAASYPHLALVGKGICFDTGGHNLKPARYMAGMHEDMNGSAVVLGLLQVISELGLPVVVDAWLALAQNHLSPQAYKQNDVIRTLAGTTIEVVHTDAEGRMVLTDTLTLATRGTPADATAPRSARSSTARPVGQPDLVVDFATLTGSMITALGNRYAGVFATSDELAQWALSAGRLSGERVCLFPMDEDYEAALESKVADVKQCTLEGEADHILAACLLKRFTHQRPWLHVDLAAASCSAGLGAVATDQTGFGVAWGLALVQQWLAASAAHAS